MCGLLDAQIGENVFTKDGLGIQVRSHKPTVSLQCLEYVGCYNEIKLFVDNLHIENQSIGASEMKFSSEKSGKLRTVITRVIWAKQRLNHLYLADDAHTLCLMEHWTSFKALRLNIICSIILPNTRRVKKVLHVKTKIVMKMVFVFLPSPTYTNKESGTRFNVSDRKKVSSLPSLA